MTLRAYLVELVGTFLVILFSAGTVCAYYLNVLRDGPQIGLVALAVAQGAVLAVVLTVTTRVSSGCANPAITLAMWVTKRVDAGRACALILVQLTGAAFAGVLLLGVFDQSTLTESYVGTPHLRAFIENKGDVKPGDWLLGSVVEASLSLLLTLAVLTTLLEQQRSRIAPLIVGLAMTAAVLLGYHLTGAGVNPARWFGTAIWQRMVSPLQAQAVFRDHLPYWMGPIVGALLGAVIYAEWLRPEEKKG
jgi:MIP family channel proteins